MNISAAGGGRKIGFYIVFLRGGGFGAEGAEKIPTILAFGLLNNLDPWVGWGGGGFPD